MTDRRIAKTRRALRDALLTLMAEHGWDELNVQDLCDMANVGRSTFYLHYQSKEDLLSESLNDLRLVLGSGDAGARGVHQSMAFLGGLLAHMVENRRLFKSVVGRRSGHAVERRFRDMVTQLVDDDLCGLTMEQIRKKMVARSLSGAIVDLMSWWVDTSDEVPVMVLENFLRDLAQSQLK
ncbi:TetR/AcrR family transcriptional regulator [Collimonas silvisoli]|uniref:TetR/AcrR family transcriptional regulator n=1 Tax=Collimonas silvisoli TaxID=2825884 RepID=UPI001B8C225D|nr:TetR/AcrR family transcriptional regulator [Collimonas silvisoli]